MDSNKNLTVINNSNNLPFDDLILDKESNIVTFKPQLEENYYKKLFIEEMNFRKSPNILYIKNIIRKQCQAVEYFSSIGDNNRAMKYKLFHNIFLNDPQVIEILDKENCNTMNIPKESKNNSIKKILMLNKKKNSDEFNYINDDFNGIKHKCIFMFRGEKEKYDELIKKKNELENKNESNNLINEEINSQKNNFKKNLLLKLQKKKSSNESKILQGIQKVFIDEKNLDNKIKNEIPEEKEKDMVNSIEKNMNNINNNNELRISKKISPIKLSQNYSEKDASISNDLRFSSNNNESNPLLTSANNKKNTSEFEPLTPCNNDNSEKTKEFKSSAKQDMSLISSVNETNDFSLLNNDTIKTEENLNKKNVIISDEISLNDNDTKYSNNSKSILSNLSPNMNNTSLNLNESNSNNIPKSFRLDFNDLFEYIKDHQNSSKKTKAFCSDIKIIIEKYINDFNIYLSKNILEKIIKKFSDIYEERFNKYTEITEAFDKEIKEIDFNSVNKNKTNISELSKLIDNINIEKENALNQNEEKFMNEIENNEKYFKANYNKIDNGILLMNEKFEYDMTKRVCDMFNNFS